MAFPPSLLQALPSSSRQALLNASRSSSSTYRHFHLSGPTKAPPPPSSPSAPSNNSPSISDFLSLAQSRPTPGSKSLRPFTDRLSNLNRNPTHTLHVSSTTNNTILTYSNIPSNPNEKAGPVKGCRTITGGIDKDFKKANRSSYEAAHQASIKMFKAIKERIETDGREHYITVAFKGMFGQGREAVAAALAGPEGEEIRGRMVRVEDRTPIKIGGTRAPKPRRL